MKATRLILWIIGTLVVLFFVWPMLVGPSPIAAILSCLPLGWWHFLMRNYPEITYNWSLIGTGAICSVLMLMLGHWFMGKVVRGWRWRWTFGGYASIWILFAIAFGASGVYRHTTWLLSYNQPWYERRVSHRLELETAEILVSGWLKENDCDFGKTRSAVRAEKSPMRAGTMFCEDYQVVFYGKSTNTIDAYLVIPRNPKAVAFGQFAVYRVADAKLFDFRPLPKLQQTLAEMEAQYPLNIGL